MVQPLSSHGSAVQALRNWGASPLSIRFHEDGPGAHASETSPSQIEEHLQLRRFLDIFAEDDARRQRPPAVYGINSQWLYRDVSKP